MKIEIEVEKTMAKAASKKASGKRETIAPNGDKRYIRRNEKGQIKESDDVGRSLSQDKKRAAKTEVKAGYGDRGDQKRPAAKKSAAKKSSASSKKAK